MNWLWTSFGTNRKQTSTPRHRTLNLETLECRRLLATGVTYHGGPLLQNVQVENVYYGSTWGTDSTLQQTISQTDGFLQYLVTSPYFDAFSQYSINHGSFVNRDDLVSQNPTNQTIDDSQIRQTLDAEISAGHLAAAGSNSLYVFYTAPGVTVTANGQNSNSDFAGYHDTFTDSAGAAVYYAVIPYPNGGVAPVQLSTFQQETIALSHETAEAVTDPDTQTGWFASNGDEIADLANGQFGLLNGYTVSGIWSQSAGQAIIPSATTTTPGSSGTTSGAEISGTQVQATAGQPFTGIVATITNGPASATDYGATITWGDGQTSTGTITADPNGGFDVTGTNTFATAGSFAVTVAVTDANGNAIGSALTTASVAATAPTVSANGTQIAATAGQSFSGGVATFTDSSPGATAGNYTATIDWGDGTISTGTIVASGSGFVVNGTHTYATSSNFDSPFGPAGGHGLPGTPATSYDVVRVTIHDTPANNSATALSLATIAPPPVVIAATGENIATASGQAFSGVVASFTDASSGVLAGDFTATITWGDGTTSTGTVTADGTGFVVTGSHTYTTTHDWFGFHDGFDHEFAVSVQITDTTTSDQATTFSLATVAPTATNLTVAAQNISATVGQSFTGVVATFTDVNGSLGLGNFTATINWGDGTTSAGTIVANPNGGFEVTGTHTYAAVGNPTWFGGGPRFDFGFGGSDDTLPLTVNVQATTGSDAGQSQSQATVTPPALNVTASGTLFSAVFGTAFTGTVATITAPGGVAGLTATIDWGDGTTSTGTIVADPHGGYDVTGTHTYGYPGNGGWGFGLFGHTTPGPQPFLVQVTLTNPTAGATAKAVGLASVTALPPTLVASGLNLNLSTSSSFSGTVATFTDSDGSPASSFTATIVWGDGTISTGTIAANGANGFLVGGTHTYKFGGTYALFVVIHDTDGSRAIALGSSFVGDNTPLSMLGPVALGFFQSAEYYSDLIAKFYQQLLNRAPSSGELSWWVNAMEQGATDTQVQAAFLSSPEYAAHAGAGNKAYVDALYQSLLGRGADIGGEAYWLGLLASGVSKSAVALGMTDSQEHEGQVLESFYQTYLGRSGNGSEVGYWISAFESGLTNAQIAASFLSSQAYFQEQHSNAQDWLTSAYETVLSRKPDPNGLNHWLGVLGQ